MRLAFVVLLVGAIIWAVAGFVAAVMFIWIDLRPSTSFTAARLVGQIQSAFVPVALAALGVLAGAVLLGAYLGKSEKDRLSTAPKTEASKVATRRGPIGSALMRLLFALTVVFALLWAGTGIATSRKQVEVRTAVRALSSPEEERPDDLFITLASVNYAAYSGGVASLAIMAAGWMVGAHKRPLDTSE